MSAEQTQQMFDYIPTGWDCIKLIDCTTDGNISYGIVQPGQHTDDGIPIIRVNNVNSGQLLLDDVLKVAPSVEKKYNRTRLAGGEVLLTLVGSTGQSFIAPKELAGWNVPRAIAVIRPRSDIGANWINICLQSKPVQHFLDIRANTTVQKTLNLKDVRNIPIPIPPESIKERIESIAIALQNKIELNRQINQTLEQTAQAIFKSWFVDFEPIKAKVDAKQNSQDPERAAMRAISGKMDDELDQNHPDQLAQLTATATLFPDELVDSELGLIPKGWGGGTMKDCCLRIESGGTPKRKESSYWDGNIRWLSSGEVRDIIVIDTKEKITEDGLNNSSAKLWPIGSTVVAMYGATAGQVCFLASEMAANQACCALIPDVNYQSYIFLSARRSIKDLSGKASGSAQQNLNKSLVAGHRVLLPTEQVLAKFEQITTPLLKNWIKNIEQNFTLAQLRDTLLPKLLSGEISVGTAQSKVREAV